MLVKFFARGVGKGSGPVQYITRKDSPNTGQLREPTPEIIRGNPELTQQLIDGLDFQYKYNSGVLSFAVEDAPTDKDQQAIIDSFEEYAFAGITSDCYNTLWVRHTHTGSDRVELHFVTPKVELDTGKSLNIAPPGWHGYFKPWQTYWNIKEDWARPDDLSRQRIYSPGYQALIDAERQRAGLAIDPDPKQQLTDYITQRIEARLITNRDHIINSFAELGLEIPRQGKNYITVVDPETNDRYRLQGGIYEASWRLGGQSQEEDRSREQTPGADSRTPTTGTRATTEDPKKRILTNYRQESENWLKAEQTTISRAMEENHRIFKKYLSRQWIWISGAAGSLCLGILGGSWVLIGFSSMRITQNQTQLDQINQEIEQQQETLNHLKKETKGIKIYETSNGTFITPPPYQQLTPGWTCQGQPCLKIE